MKCKAITALGLNCAHSAVENGYCRKHQNRITEEDRLREEFGDYSTYEIVTFVENSTCGRVKLNMHLPHEALTEQAIEALI